MAREHTRSRALRTRPVKVTAHLAEPIAGEPPHLDALLEWAVSKHAASIERHDRRGRHQGIQPSPHRGEPPPPLGRIPIPIARERVGEWLVARCSSPIYRIERESTARLASRLSHDEIAPRLAADQARTIHHGSGATKALYRPIRLLHVDRVVWFALARATRPPVSDLRKRVRVVPALGKYTGHGYGRVARWEVEGVDDDWSWWAPGPDGEALLMRPLPWAALVDDATGYRRTHGACCPPYWHPERVTEIAAPC